jgi:predicted DNA-binding protein
MPPPRNILLNFRLPEAEADLLARHAKATGRTKSDLLREFIRSLEKPPRPK